LDWAILSIIIWGWKIDYKMVSIKTPRTLVKLGRYDDSLEEAVRKCSEPLTNVLVGLGSTVKYAVFKEATEPYLLMVSQQKDGIVTAPGYNVLLTVASYSDLRNQQVTTQFEKETGINLNIEVPEQLRRQFEMVSLSFQVFEKNPRAAMAVLRGEL